MASKKQAKKNEKKTLEDIIKEPFYIALNRRTAGFFKCPVTGITLTPKSDPLEIDPEETDLRYIESNIRRGYLNVVDKEEKVILSMSGLPTDFTIKRDLEKDPIKVKDLTDEDIAKVEHIVNKGSLMTIYNYISLQTQEDMAILKKIKQLEGAKRTKKRVEIIRKVDERIEELKEFDKEAKGDDE
jgi:hypothetical protein